MKKNLLVKRAIYYMPLPGGKLVLLGAFAMLIWAIWECAVRLDAMDGMTKAYFNLVRDGKVTLTEAIENILNTPEAKKDWINPIILSAIALFSIFTMLFHGKWKMTFLYIPVCVLIFFYQTSDNMLVRFMNLFEVIKYGACGAIAAGSLWNTGSALYRRREYFRRLKTRRDARRLQEGPRSRTMIPKKTSARKKAG
ncbi:MAG: hypothetical protein IJC48_06665 [Clostridia bacterium]|nr:hypothetical protein [Clostridia bacterium]